MPFFSIIIPTFNCERTLTSCLESVLTQSFLDFEVLVMDGQSTDATVSIALNTKDIRVLVFSEPDNGIYDAMNKGIKRAKGKWLYFLGSDDSLYEYDILGCIYNTIIANYSLDVIYGNVLMLPSNKVYDGIFTYDKMQTVTLCHQAIFYKKKIFEDFGLYKIKYKVLADHDMNLNWFFSNKHQNIFINKTIAKYSESGFSSVCLDMAFEYDFSKKLFWHGLKKFSIYRLKELAMETAIVRRKNIIDFILYKSFYYILRFANIIERVIFKKNNTYGKITIS